MSTSFCDSRSSTRAGLAMAVMLGVTALTMPPMDAPTVHPWELSPNGSSPRKKQRPKTHWHKPSAKRNKFGFR